MKYLKPFNESSGYEFKDFSLWIPGFFENMRSIMQIVNEFNTVDIKIRELLSVDVSFINPDIFIKRCEYVAKNRNLSNSTELSKEYSHILSMYNRWGILKRLDINVYYDIKDIFEDICDNNDCSFSSNSIHWVSYNFNSVNYLAFEFLIHDTNGKLEKMFGTMTSDVRMPDKKADKIWLDIEDAGDRLKYLSCRSTRVYSNNVIIINIETKE